MPQPRAGLSRSTAARGAAAAPRGQGSQASQGSRSWPQRSGSQSRGASRTRSCCGRALATPHLRHAGRP
eukprot:10795370-Alexandrium_andersonii.AAC.1